VKSADNSAKPAEFQYSKIRLFRISSTAFRPNFLEFRLFFQKSAESLWSEFPLSAELSNTGRVENFLSIELVLIQWEGSMTQRGDVTTSAGGDVAPRRGIGGNDASWADTNFTGPKNKENPRG
jgi:hypothetical protein